MASGCFDTLASEYDRLWTESEIGRLQRGATWRRILPLFQPSQTVLDLGCGTGEDSVALQSRGVRVHAIDASPEMVRLARSRGIHAECRPIEQIATLEGVYDGAISNFGALNCIENLSILRQPLARLVRPDGYLAFTWISRFCLLETLYYFSRLEPGKAVRRWPGRSHAKSLNLDVFYPTGSTLEKAFAPSFRLISRAGIGLFVPPSYFEGISASSLEFRARIDRFSSHWPLLRSIADHQLFVFQRQ